MKIFDTKKKRVVAICIASVLAIGGVLGVLKLCGVFDKGIKNSAWARACKLRAENAQYVPSAEILMGTNADGAGRAVSRMTDEVVAEGDNEETNGGAMTAEEYEELVNEASRLIHHPYLGRVYNIQSARKEIMSVFEHFDRFDVWLYSGDYQTNEMPMYFYYIKYDPDTKHITVYGQSLYGELGVVGTMSDACFACRIDYYYNEDGKEVIEYQMQSVKKDTSGKPAPMESAYFKNIEDTSFTKVDITYASSQKMSGGEGMHSAGHDYYEKYGLTYSNITINYANSNNITISKIYQSGGEGYNEADIFQPEHYVNKDEIENVYSVVDNNNKTYYYYSIFYPFQIYGTITNYTSEGKTEIEFGQKYGIPQYWDEHLILPEPVFEAEIDEPIEKSTLAPILNPNLLIALEIVGAEAELGDDTDYKQFLIDTLKKIVKATVDNDQIQANWSKGINLAGGQKNYYK